MRLRTILVLIVFSPLALHARGQVDYAREVRPIFQKACYSCHGAEKQKGELRLDVKMLALKGGESGRAIVPGKSRESLLIKLVRGEDEDRPGGGDPPHGGKTSKRQRAFLDETSPREARPTARRAEN